MLAADVFAAFGGASLLLAFDPSRAIGVLTALGLVLLLGSITLAAPYMISVGAQGLNVRFPSLGPSAAWVGLQGVATVIAIAIALLMFASWPAGLIALAAGVLLGVILRVGQ